MSQVLGVIAGLSASTQSLSPSEFRETLRQRRGQLPGPMDGDLDLKMAEPSLQLRGMCEAPAAPLLTRPSCLCSVRAPWPLASWDQSKQDSDSFGPELTPR